ncbi:hypothetical protein PTKIN_Ptkin09bG0173400 [Pterospermum kingtungense]
MDSSLGWGKIVIPNCNAQSNFSFSLRRKEKTICFLGEEKKLKRIPRFSRKLRAKRKGFFFLIIMGKVKNDIGYEEVDDYLEDLRFDSLLKKKFGMLESFSASYDSNSKGDEKEINEHGGEIDMEEDSTDSTYEMFLNNLEQYGYGHDHEEELYTDPEYKMFLENIKEDGDGESYSAEIRMSSDISVVICYGEKEERTLKNLYRKRNFKRDSKRVMTKVPKNLGGFSTKAKAKMLKTRNKSCEIGNEESNNNLRDVPREKRKIPVYGNKVKEEVEVDFVPCKSNGEPSKKMNCGGIDESYSQLLDYLNKSGNNMELSHESDDISTHQKNDGSCSELEMFELDNIPLHGGHYTPFVPSKCFQSLPGEESWGHVKASSPSQFREKLMDLLKIPYDRQEFENLWREVTCRKPVEASKELRGRVKPYPTKIKGKSYLDWYKELKMKIDEFRDDRRKILFLLRGFFFWLKNTGHEGAFQPWLDSLYLNALG